MYYTSVGAGSSGNQDQSSIESQDVYTELIMTLGLTLTWDIPGE